MQAQLYMVKHVTKYDIYISKRACYVCAYVERKIFLTPPWKNIIYTWNFLDTTLKELYIYIYEIFLNVWFNEIDTSLQSKLQKNMAPFFNSVNPHVKWLIQRVEWINDETDKSEVSALYNQTRLYIHILSSTDRLFRSIRTLQCG